MSSPITMRRPDRSKAFNQRAAVGHQAGYGHGVCYGMCVMLGSSIALRNERATLGSDEAYKLIGDRIDDGSIAEYAVRYHNAVPQRAQRTPGYGSMRPHTPYLVKCHISYGWNTGLWGALHYVNYTWRNSGNHACLIYRTHNDTVLFDPNWGAALWNGDLPTTCGVLVTYNTIADMIVHGYRADCSVSIEGLEILENEIRV